MPRQTTFRLIAAGLIFIPALSFGGYADLLDGAEVLTDVRVGSSFKDNRGDVIGNAADGNAYTFDGGAGTPLTAKDGKSAIIALVKKKNGERFKITGTIRVACREGKTCVPAACPARTADGPDKFAVTVPDLESWEKCLAALEKAEDAASFEPVLED